MLRENCQTHMQSALEERAIIIKGSMRKMDNLQLGKNRILKANVREMSLHGNAHQ